MRQIRQLSSYMSDLIAAGEVVERPMSVVKELLENSIDSKATEITVEIENGGISYIRIADNGVGMDKNDAPIAFLRHATSKIYEQDDLIGIKTLGFRGEALAAISAVSKIDLFTKKRDEKQGTLVSISAGEIQSIKEVGATDGTTMIVRDLFYNMPARMKFLKKDYTEASYIFGVVQNLALSNPDISFRYIKDGKTLLKTNGKGDLKSTIYSVLGKDATQELIEVKPYDIDGIYVSGFISKPHASKNTRGMQHFFINGRYVKSRLIMAGLEESYKNSIMHGKFPYCVLNIKIDEKKVDVNVHPTKLEVKFDHEKKVFDVVYIGCKHALENQNIIVKAQNLKPIIKDEPEPELEQFEILEVQKTVYAQPQNQASYETKQSYQNFDELNASVPIYQTKQQIKHNISIECEDDFDEIIDAKQAPFQNMQKPEKTIITEKSIAKPVKIIGECFNTYILCEYEGEMIIIDKHAGHERINFNKLMKNIGNIQQQVLLAPQIVTISSGEFGDFIENLEQINKIGFLIEEFSNNSVVVREIPTILEKDCVEDIIHEIAYKLKNNKNIKIDKIDDIMHTVACKSAIKGNKYTNQTELENLAQEVLFNKEVNYCPHGRPVKIAITKNQLEKMFKRIV